MTVLVLLNDIFGVGMLASIFMSTVYGANLWQSFTYYTTYSLRDGIELKLMVAFLLCVLSLVRFSSISFFELFNALVQELWSLLCQVCNVLAEGLITSRKPSTICLFNMSQKAKFIPVAIVHLLKS
ncbi:hypothetical protein BC834DRAFT_847897 [Gloeopeniophorella convolvens]|nr:hypothetical protein BC834DRAFT_847897 [Gloeopeniophorella convolvens]